MVSTMVTRPCPNLKTLGLGFHGEQCWHPISEMVILSLFAFWVFVSICLRSPCGSSLVGPFGRRFLEIHSYSGQMAR